MLLLILALLIAGRLLLLPFALLLLTLLLGLLLLLFQQLFDQIMVETGILMGLILLQCVFIGRQGLGQQPLLGQGVATIIVTVGAVDFTEQFSRSIVLAGAVVGMPLPGRVLKAFGGLGRLVLLQQTSALLIGTQPQIAPFQRGGGPGRRTRRHGHQHTGQNAAAKHQRGQRQHQEQQPGPLFTPQIGGNVLSGLAATLPSAVHRLLQQQIKIAVIGAQQGKAAAARRGKLAEPGGVEPGNHDGAVAVFEKAAHRRRNGRTLGCAHRQHRHPPPLGADVLYGIHHPRSLGAIGDEDNVSSRGIALPEQGVGFTQRQVRPAALTGHDVSRQRGHHGLYSPGILGQGRDHEGFVGKHHESRLPLLGAVQNIPQFVLGANQAGRLDIGGIHGAGQIQHHHPGQFALIHRLGQLAPHGTSQGGDGDDPRQGDQYQRQKALPPRLPGQQMREQVGIAHLAPRRAGQMPPVEQPQQSGQRQ